MATIRTKMLALAAAAGALTLASGAAKADSCEPAIQPYVEWSKGTTVPKEHRVYVTISTHFVGKVDLKHGTPNPVFFSYGEVFASAAKGADVLAGTAIPLRSSNSDFAHNAKNTVDFSITADGKVTYVEKINGKAIGGMPPVKFNGVCNGGLITGVVGTKAYAIGFSGTEFQNPS